MPRRFALFSFITIVIGLSACTPKAVPDGYTGGVAHITDSIVKTGRFSAEGYALVKINGQPFDDRGARKIHRTPGGFFEASTEVVGRDVPATPATFTIIGQTIMMNILLLANKHFEVSGDVSFTPEPGKDYFVKGILGENYSAVWIEDKSGQVVDRKIEAYGPTAR